ncbi:MULTISPECIES: hypothetical protein [Rhizobium/Agrobacterium group]|uniref:hypothetical protein n=1 Tax=Rhizobium/Agrobacterium group TaxID=227290 RepID=UPI0003F1EC55|nr:MULTISPECIES: hypothetical protein [Rhizobium/Agrobacterium group]AHK04426.1 hypothetical protein X971_4582 [Agrobacterium tumefaciens LBA4213 (Ach5)]AKC10166.1 hypothetical protein Ach5_43930 [Agrobacterium tumefaciens]AYM19310.1 hypothetical protein At15955_43250 [Agrobacterium tumefaciens]AYM70611.1 hypothetical protein AtA6_43950 [Agrobacterium tumefaciens]NIB57113.1 hypothetical protein [Agrobacterium tumefaciens]
MNIAGRLSLTAMIALATTPSLASEDMASQTSEAIFGFGGVLTKEDMLKSAALVPVEYEKNAILGGGYQFYPYRIGNVKLGGEIGVAVRFGKGFTGEVWAGPVARYDKIRLGDRLFVSPSFTAGLSLVSDAQPGRERQEEIKDNGNANVLFYLGPEINVSFSEESSTEFFWRLHHRSGGGKTLGNMKGATNANVFGVRYKF